MKVVLMLVGWAACILYLRWLVVSAGEPYPNGHDDRDLVLAIMGVVGYFLFTRWCAREYGRFFRRRHRRRMEGPYGACLLTWRLAIDALACILDFGFKRHGENLLTPIEGAAYSELRRALIVGDKQLSRRAFASTRRLAEELPEHWPPGEAGFMLYAARGAGLIGKLEDAAIDHTLVAGWLCRSKGQFCRVPPDIYDQAFDAEMKRTGAKPEEVELSAEAWGEAKRLIKEQCDACNLEPRWDAVARKVADGGVATEPFTFSAVSIVLGYLPEAAHPRARFAMPPDGQPDGEQAHAIREQITRKRKRPAARRFKTNEEFNRTVMEAFKRFDELPSQEAVALELGCDPASFRKWQKDAGYSDYAALTDALWPASRH